MGVTAECERSATASQELSANERACAKPSGLGCTASEKLMPSPLGDMSFLPSIAGCLSDVVKDGPPVPAS